MLCLLALIKLRLMLTGISVTGISDCCDMLGTLFSSVQLHFFATTIQKLQNSLTLAYFLSFYIDSQCGLDQYKLKPYADLILYCDELIRIVTSPIRVSASPITK
jgi:hypothetical protein